jgi:hypothetical protein
MRARLILGLRSTELLCRRRTHDHDRCATSLTVCGLCPLDE